MTLTDQCNSEQQFEHGRLDSGRGSDPSGEA
jgi:hypothetical protein